MKSLLFLVVALTSMADANMTRHDYKFGEDRVRAVCDKTGCTVFFPDAKFTPLLSISREDFYKNHLDRPENMKKALTPLF